MTLPMPRPTPWIRAIKNSSHDGLENYSSNSAHKSPHVGLCYQICSTLNLVIVIRRYVDMRTDRQRSGQKTKRIIHSVWVIKWCCLSLSNLLVILSPLNLGIKCRRWQN